VARQHRFSERFRPIAGGALVGLGLHILLGNLDRVATQMRHFSGASAEEALGVLPSLVLATARAVQSYTLDHQVFLLALLRTLVSCWPLLLVIVGTTLLQDAPADGVEGLPAPTKYFQN
jgi:hypothetical protein